MKTDKKWLEQPYLYYHAEDFPKRTTGLTYFALTDALIHHAANINQPIIYFWPSDRLIFLGMIDTKLPFLKDAVKVLSEANYDYVVRNSGGLAVVSDPGILNFSIIFPDEEAGRLTINDAYERMHDVISKSLEPYNVTVEAKEIPESYCPGDYDLSINGLKIAGISQRRILGGLAIMIYIGIDGVQIDRSQLIKTFYEQGLKGQDVKWHYPDIELGVMTTVSDQIDEVLTVSDMVDLILNMFANYGSVEAGTYSEDVLNQYDESYDKMVKRNVKMLGSLFDEKEYIDEH